jgi:gamma-glutamylaminecyclotransferase
MSPLGMAALIFVYGTLRRGQPNHAQMGRARFVRRATTAPRYQLVDLGSYPALLEDGETAVHGEVYEVDEPQLPQLDAFEDVPSLYQRKPVEIPGLSVLGYVMRRETAGDARAIASGDWCARESASAD